MNKITTKKWDAVEYLDSPEMIREYLKVSFEEGDSEQLMMAIGQVAKAQGISEIAKKANLSRQNLYKALSQGGSPKFETVRKVVEALGCKLGIV
ncbi:putative addiction module antidote protein [Desulfobulbus sp. F4]|nr:putative addiction module antidote protein [Desulfobulbus sp. F3]MCW5200975.1 putative addiction module antidote protein [Desulfobulbus sp. F4]